MANLINEAKRMKQLAGILTESQLNEVTVEWTKELGDKLKDKFEFKRGYSGDNTVSSIALKGDSKILGYYAEDPKSENYPLAKNNPLFGKTIINTLSDDNELAKAIKEPQAESQELNEVEDAEEFRKQVEAGQTTIQATISMPQEKEGTVWKSGTEKVGTIVLKNLKRLDRLKYEGILENDGGHKPLVPFKGKKLILGDFPEIGNGSLTDEEGAKDITKGIRILFKLKTWPEFVGGQQTESLDIEEIVNEALKSVRK